MTHSTKYIIMVMQLRILYTNPFDSIHFNYSDINIYCTHCNIMRNICAYGQTLLTPDSSSVAERIIFYVTRVDVE